MHFVHLYRSVYPFGKSAYILMLKTASYAVRVGCCVHVFHRSIYEVTETSGESMMPTINYKDDYVHVNKFNKLGRRCQFGDIVVVAKPTDPSQRVCKRITGMPRDFVLIDPSDPHSHDMIQVPDGHIWVTGDNLSHSIDSRTYGPLPMALIKGRVVAASLGFSVRKV